MIGKPISSCCATTMRCSSDARHRGRVDRVIVFDLDDTLYLERDYVASGLLAVGKWAEQQIGLSDLADAMIALFRAGRRGQIFDTALAAAGVAPSPELVTRMVNVYRQHLPRINLAEDAARFLSRPREGTGFAIITDGYLVSQKKKIRALRVFERGIRLVICTDRWGRDHWKPSPRAFEHVEAHFGLPPGAFTYVADNPLKDFIAPKRAGWTTVQISRESRIAGTEVEPSRFADHQIVTFDQINDNGSIS